MDPVSISLAVITTADTARRVGLALYEFYHSLQETDETVHGLHSGVKQVEDICRLMDKQIKLLPPSKSEILDDKTQDDDLFRVIEVQLSECLAVIHRINSKIDPVRQPSTGLMRQMQRQWRLNMRREDINECRTQLQNGVQNLQLGLQLVNIQATFLAPKIPNQALLDKLNEIQHSISLQGVTEAVKECANSYYIRGTTLYTESAAPSVVGLPSKPDAIADWLGQVEALRLHENNSSPYLVLEEDLCSASLPSLTTEETNSPSINKARSSYIGTSDIDDEDEYAIEIAQVALRSGRTAFNSGNYNEAETMLEECLELIKLLPEHRRQKHDREEIHLLLALCAYHNHDLSTAEAALESTLVTETEEHVTTKLAAGFSLVMVYIRLGKYEQARISCENVYRGRRRLLGKDDELCFDTLALLVRINELQNLPVRANIHRNMIPEDKQATFCQRYDDLVCETNSRPLARRHTSYQPLLKEWMQLPDNSPHWIVFSKDGNMMACALRKTRFTKDAKIELRAAHEGTLLRELLVRGDDPPGCLAFDDSGQKLASGHGGWWRKRFMRSDGYTPLSVRIWDVKTGTLLHRYFPMPDYDRLWMISLNYNPEGTRLLFTYGPIAQYKDGRLPTGFMVLDSQDGTQIYRSSYNECWVRGFSKDGSRVILQSKTDITILNTKQYSKVLEHHEIPNMVSAAYRNDDTLVVLQSDGKATMYKNDQITSTHQLTFHPKEKPNQQYIHGSLFPTPGGHTLVTLQPAERNCVYVAVPELNIGAKLPGKDINTIVSYWDVSSDCKYLLWASTRTEGHGLRIWSLDEELGRMEQHGGGRRSSAGF